MEAIETAQAMDILANHDDCMACLEGAGKAWNLADQALLESIKGDTDD